MQATDASALLQPVLRAAQEAGERAMSHWVDGEPCLTQWEKSPNQPVSGSGYSHRSVPARGARSDRAPTRDGSRRKARTRLGGRTRGESGWLIPSTARADFVRGRSGWAVSVALVEAGEVIIGVLVAPARGEHYWATKGGGRLSQRLSYTGQRMCALVGRPRSFRSTWPRRSRLDARRAPQTASPCVW